jgi:hypothetical protein
MNPSTTKALDRILKQMSKPPRAPRSRFSIAPVILGIGLVVGYQLTSRLVPMVWGSMLPGGLDQARHFRGWPGLVWVLAVHCHRDFAGTVAILAAIGGLGLVMATLARPLRPIVWLMAAGVIAADAGIVYVTLRTSIEATAQNVGIM